MNSYMIWQEIYLQLWRLSYTDGINLFCTVRVWKKGKKIFFFLFQIISDMCHNHYLAWHNIICIFNEEKKKEHHLEKI